MNRLRFDNWPGVLSGALLGDGYRVGNAIVSKHTNPQRNYVLAKYRMFKQMGLRVTKRMDFSMSTNLGKRMYSQVKVWCPDKRLFVMLPADLIRQLSPVGLLVCWLDNGSLSVHEKQNGTSVSRFGYLNTQRHSKSVNELLRDAFAERWGLQLAVHIDRGGIAGPEKTYYRLYFNATNMRKLIDIVRGHIPFVPSNMRYKLNMGYRPTSRSYSRDFMNRYNF